MMMNIFIKILKWFLWYEAKLENMKSEALKKLRGNLTISVIIVTLSLITLLVPYSLFIGWNLFTSILFWFIFVPLISILTARFYNNPEKRLLAGIIGCLFFYFIIIFMIYGSYQSDQFKLMIVSLFSSILMIWFLNKNFMSKKFVWKK